MEKQKIIIANIDKTSEKIHKIWNDLSIYDIENLKQAWHDELCDEFIKKIKNTDNTIVRIIDQLELLKECWQQKLDMVDEQEVIK